MHPEFHHSHATQASPCESRTLQRCRICIDGIQRLVQLSLLRSDSNSNDEGRARPCYGCASPDEHRRSDDLVLRDGSKSNGWRFHILCGFVSLDVFVSGHICFFQLIPALLLSTLINGVTFASHCTLIYFEVDRLNYHCVRWYLVTNFKAQNIAYL